MPLKGKSFEEIVKTEIAAGKPQAQAVAIAYKTTGKKNLNWRDTLDTLEMRSQRGTQRYASKKNEDEASEEEHEIDKDEIEKKKQEDEVDKGEEQFDELQRKRDTNY